VVVDVGAAGKGYLVDLVGELLSDLGVDTQVVDAGGDLRSRGVPLRVALEHPADPSKAIGVVELGGGATDGALCASASNRRAWGAGLHHVLDAITGAPTADVVATWAIAPTALIADGAATALFFDTDPRFYADHGVSTVRMFSNGRVEYSPSFSGELFR
jgi:thiamine biosynthesis lipoprotein